MSPTKSGITRNHARALVFLGALAIICIAYPVRRSRAAKDLTPSAGNTITVNSTATTVNATDGKCTLQEAITAANTNTASGVVPGECAAGSSSDPDTINFTVSGSFSAAPITDITSSIVFAGTPGAPLQKMGVANNFQISAGSPVVVTFSDLEIKSAIRNLSNATLNVTNSVFDDRSGGGDGGAIRNIAGTVNLLNCTFTTNQGSRGGALYNDTGTLNIANSTFHGNRADTSGGAIYNNTGTLNITNSTFATNRAQNGTGGGIFTNGPANIRNTIIATNLNTSATQAPDVFGAFTSQGHNLIGASDGSTGFTNGVNGDKVGMVAAPIDPLVVTSGNFGGPTFTMPLLPGSPAIDGGDNCVTQPAHCSDSTLPQLTTDQRGAGFNRAVDTSGSGTPTVDIGAFESRGFNISVASGSPQSAFVNTSFGQGLVATVTSSFGEPVIGGRLTFTAPTTGASAIFAGNNSTVPASIQGSPATAFSGPLAANNIVGSYTVSAGGSGIASPAIFTLTNTPPPTLSINSVATSEGDIGTKTLTFTVTLSAASSLTVTANFATANGSALASSDYVANSGTVTFNPGDLTKPIGVTINGDTTFEPDETFVVNLSSPVNATISTGQGTGTILNDDAQGGVLSFSLSNYLVNETDKFVTITVNRGGDVSGSATVDYATDDTGAPTSCGTSNGKASSVCDYTKAAGTLKFAAGETSKQFQVLLTQDAYAEGAEVINLNLSNTTGGAGLGVPSSATVTIAANGALPANPIDDPQEFVRQHYHDFLNREPDASGLAFWTNQITSCGADLQCIEVKRINVSASFFLSIEFQETGYLVERLNKASFGDVLGVSTLNGSHTLAVPFVRFNEFMRDAQQIGAGVIVNQPGWENALEANKQAFILEFVQRSQFVSRYPTSLTPAQFVDALYANTGVVPSAAERTAAINEFGAATNTGNTSARARALRRVAENPTFVQVESNRAFVLMEYFGYLRRNPNDPPDSDYTGYDFWLTKLNQFGGNFVNAEMVKAFISSLEYRQRFGP